MTATLQANVFVFEQTRQAVDGAQRFGNVMYIFDRSTHEARAGIWDTEKLQEDIRNALAFKGFVPERDYICVTGHVASLAVLIAAVIAQYGTAQFLIYDSTSKAYVGRTLGEAFDESE